MGTEKRMIRKGKELSRRPSLKFDVRELDEGFEGTDRRRFPVLASAFTHLQGREEKGRLIEQQNVPPTYKEVGDYVFKVLGGSSIIGVIDRELHPELDGMTLSEIQEVELSYMTYYKLDNTKFLELSIEHGRAEAAEVFCILFPEITGGSGKRKSPKNIRELRKLARRKEKDDKVLKSEIGLVFELCFTEVPPSSLN